MKTFLARLFDFLTSYMIILFLAAGASGYLIYRSDKDLKNAKHSIELSQTLPVQGSTERVELYGDFYLRPESNGSAVDSLTNTLKYLKPNEDLGTESFLGEGASLSFADGELSGEKISLKVSKLEWESVDTGVDGAKYSTKYGAEGYSLSAEFDVKIAQTAQAGDKEIVISLPTLDAMCVLLGAKPVSIRSLQLGYDETRSAFVGKRSVYDAAKVAGEIAGYRRDIARGAFWRGAGIALCALMGAFILLLLIRIKVPFLKAERKLGEPSSAGSGYQDWRSYGEGRCLKCGGDRELAAAFDGFLPQYGASKTTSGTFGKTVTTSITGAEPLRFALCAPCLKKARAKDTRATVITILVALALIPLEVWGIARNESGYRYNTAIMGLAFAVVSAMLLYAMAKHAYQLSKADAPKRLSFYAYSVAEGFGVKSPKYLAKLSSGAKLGPNQNVELDE
jgi:hypothetical protein